MNGRNVWAIGAATAVALCFLKTPAHAAGTTSIGTEAPFVTENDRVMTNMMRGMSILPSGDLDRDFAVVMIPHHRGAIDMAEVELRYGHNDQLRRISNQSNAGGRFWKCAGIARRESWPPTTRHRLSAHDGPLSG